MVTLEEIDREIRKAAAALGWSEAVVQEIYDQAHGIKPLVMKTKFGDIELPSGERDNP